MKIDRAQGCQQANALFAMGIAHAIQSGSDRKELYQHIRQWAAVMPVEPALLGNDRFSECSVPASG